MLRARFLFFLCLFAAGTARADSLVSLPDPAYAEPAPHEPALGAAVRVDYLVYPTIGFPALVRSGGELTPVMHLADGGKTLSWEVRLLSSGDPVTQTYECPLLESRYDAATGTYRLRATVTEAVPRDSFDLWVHSPGLPGGSDSQPNAVRVVKRFERTFRFVHIADCQTYDPRAPYAEMTGQVLEQVRFVDPEFVVFSGDLNYGSDYVQEYTRSYAIFQDSRVPVFMVPGNHDGHATIEEDAGRPGGERLDRDGLAFWRRMLGPLYYSFDYGDVWHFTAINSFDGDTKRRNARGVLIINYGGQVDAAQLGWFEQDVDAATAAGRNVVVLSHHDPRGPIQPNHDSYPWSWVKLSTMAWHQQWNDQASADRLLSLTADKNVTHWFVGHDHYSTVDTETYHAGTPQEKKVDFVQVTTMAAHSDPKDLGYRIVEVDGAAMTAYDFNPGAGEQHLPMGRPGLLTLESLGANDGSTPSATVRVTNLRSRDMDGVVELYVQASPTGYTLTGGSLQAMVRADGGQTVAYVRVSVPQGHYQDVTLDPASGASGGALFPASRVLSPAPVAGGPVRVKKSRSDLACQAGGAAGGPGALLPLLAALAGVMVLRRRVSGRPATE